MDALSSAWRPVSETANASMGGLEDYLNCLILSQSVSHLSHLPEMSGSICRQGVPPANNTSLHDRDNP
jgi:hypothetical protein